MSLKQIVPQDPSARQMIEELMNELEVNDLSRSDLYELLLRITVAASDWLFVIHLLKQLSSAQRERFFAQCFNEYEVYDSYKATQLLTSSHDIADKLPQTSEISGTLLYTLMNLLLGRED